MKDNRDPQKIGNTIRELRAVGVPTLMAADAVTDPEAWSTPFSGQVPLLATASPELEKPSQNGPQASSDTASYPPEYMD